MDQVLIRIHNASFSVGVQIHTGRANHVLHHYHRIGSENQSRMRNLRSSRKVLKSVSGTPFLEFGSGNSVVPGIPGTSCQITIPIVVNSLHVVFSLPSGVR